MSVLKMFSVYDKKVGAFTAPMFFRSKGEAIRSFTDACSREENFRRHREDYGFAYLGDWDDNTGLFEPVPSGPEFVISALDVDIDKVTS